MVEVKEGFAVHLFEALFSYRILQNGRREEKEWLHMDLVPAPPKSRKGDPALYHLALLDLPQLSC